MAMPFQSTEMSMHHSDALCWFGQILLEVEPVPCSRAWHAPWIECGHLRSHVDLLPISYCYGHVKYIAISNIYANTLFYILSGLSVFMLPIMLMLLYRYKFTQGVLLEHLG